MTTEITKPENPGNDLLPMEPCLPLDIERLMRAENVTHEENNRFCDRPPPITGDQAEAVRKALTVLEAGMTPAHRPALSSRVITMLAHYFVPDMPQTLADAVMADWIEALSEYPNWAVNAACTRWLHGNNRKPTIADVRKECWDDIYFKRLQIDKLKSILKWHERDQREATKERQNA